MGKARGKGRGSGRSGDGSCGGRGRGQVMSTVVPDAGGVVIISQVRPQNDQGNGPEEVETGNAPANMPKQVVTFYRGEPEVLGITQIFSGIVLISFDIAMIIASTFPGILFYSGVPIWSGILVTSSLVMQIITSVAATCGIIIAISEHILLLHIFTPTLHSTYCAYYKSDIQCLGTFSPLDIHYGFLSLNLILSVLVFSISVSTSVFACRTVCRSSFQEISVVIYQTTSSVVSDTTRDVPPDSTAAFSSALKTQA
ncbi:membrane-spanning 4-domains subfamily A member 4A-like isoform X2 [Phyllobates terribilis]|uniref:membrane-spanning 4-domains subfamily A member 4A-like isoform X2 n=1 Tax=Phyllobates terribilis TaxID=111132 RepID=UPI003CCAF781